MGPDAELWAQNCANCNQLLDPGNRGLFCDAECRDAAKAVRWIRKHVAAGTFNLAQVRYGLVRDEDYAGALYNKLRFAVSGGYRRTLSRAMRDEVIARDKGSCVACGRKGAEVDHIRADDSKLSNLQLLCDECHAKKTQLQSREGQRLQRRGESPRSWRALLRELVKTNNRVRDLIIERVLPSRPTKLCDSEQWQHLERRLRSDRYGHLKALLLELFDGEVPDFPPHTPWREKMAQARDDHAEMYCEIPCALIQCPECSGRGYVGLASHDPDDYPSIEAWLDDPDVHAGYEPGSYFAYAMEKDD